MAIPTEIFVPQIVPQRLPNVPQREISTAEKPQFLAIYFFGK
jgi:hypothetical protein